MISEFVNRLKNDDLDINDDVLSIIEKDTMKNSLLILVDQLHEQLGSLE